MTIGQVARATGVSPSAIRYYEAAGIIPSPARRGGVRQYEPEIIDELKAMRFFRASGIPIRSLASMAKHIRGSRAGREVWVSVLQARITELDSWMREAETTRRTLERAIECRCECKREDCAVLQAADAMTED
jgi:DNA-binding transcriptional MerR regulator